MPRGHGAGPIAHHLAGLVSCPVQPMARERAQQPRQRSERMREQAHAQRSRAGEMACGGHTGRDQKQGLGLFRRHGERHGRELAAEAVAAEDPSLSGQMPLCGCDRGGDVPFDQLAVAPVTAARRPQGAAAGAAPFVHDNADAASAQGGREGIVFRGRNAKRRQPHQRVRPSGSPPEPQVPYVTVGAAAFDQVRAVAHAVFPAKTAAIRTDPASPRMGEIRPRRCLTRQRGDGLHGLAASQHAKPVTLR